ncbi:MAG: DUF1648 domain-containing protein [Flavisolibacter sp.]
MILFVLWFGIIIFFSKMPDQVPGHFNFAGKADNYINKEYIFILPILATIIYISMTILNRHPHLYNYPVKLTAQNARRLYTSAVRLIRVIKLTVVIIFSGIVYMTYNTSVAQGGGPGAWFFPLALGLILLPNIFIFWKSSDFGKTSK